MAQQSSNELTLFTLKWIVKQIEEGVISYDDIGVTEQFAIKNKINNDLLLAIVFSSTPDEVWDEINAIIERVKPYIKQ